MTTDVILTLRQQAEDTILTGLVAISRAVQGVVA